MSALAYVMLNQSRRDFESTAFKRIGSARKHLKDHVTFRTWMDFYALTIAPPYRAHSISQYSARPCSTATMASSVTAGSGLLTALPKPDST